MHAIINALRQPGRSPALSANQLGRPEWWGSIPEDWRSNTNIVARSLALAPVPME
jgi:hypothetical protein